MVNEFKIRRQWQKPQGTSEVDVTLCKLMITISDRIVTEYVTEDGESANHLEIPAYYLAEWVAENWWPLLWEPRKSEDAGDDADFVARHSLLTAQHGFALPKIFLVPIGRNVHVSAVPRDVQFADVRFRRGASAKLPRPDLESELRSFIEKVVSRLGEFSIAKTNLQEAWELVEGTGQDEVQFCQFVGALGLSPYAENGAIETILERSLSNLGERLTMDLCLAATPEHFDEAARAAELAQSALASVPEATLEPLSTISVPPENLALPAYRRGVQAAKRIRAKLQISDEDPHGASRFFEKLKIDPSRAFQNAEAEMAESGPVSGLVSRDNRDIQIALLQRKETQRRFAAARGAYAAWASETPQIRRLMTHAVTRDQQANRAFAAEMTAPFAYIRSQIKGSKIPQDRVFELAANLNIGADVVKKHAENNGLLVAPVY